MRRANSRVHAPATGQRRAAALCELFVDTLRRGDKKGHRDIERAIQNFRPRARDPLRHLMLTLKDAQHIAAVGGGETLVLSVKQILRIVYPRHEYTPAPMHVMMSCSPVTKILTAAWPHKWECDCRRLEHLERDWTNKPLFRPILPLSVHYFFLTSAVLLRHEENNFCPG